MQDFFNVLHVWVSYPSSNNNQMRSTSPEYTGPPIYTVDQEGWIENKDGLGNNETFGEKAGGCKIWFQEHRAGPWTSFEK